MCQTAGRLAEWHISSWRRRKTLLDSWLRPERTVPTGDAKGGTVLPSLPDRHLRGLPRDRTVEVTATTSNAPEQRTQAAASSLQQQQLSHTDSIPPDRGALARRLLILIVIYIIPSLVAIKVSLDPD